jgi:hypothetical protein
MIVVGNSYKSAGGHLHQSPNKITIQVFFLPVTHPIYWREVDLANNYNPTKPKKMWALFWPRVFVKAQ